LARATALNCRADGAASLYRWGAAGKVGAPWSETGLSWIGV
jgi:hypothetical protein